MFTSTNKPIPTNTPTATLIPYQIFGRLFKEGFDSIGVSVNRNTGNLDSRNTHFDIRIPEECKQNPGDCPVYSPADGTIWEILGFGDPKGSEGWSIGIRLSQKPKGIEEVLEQFDIDPENVSGYGIHVAHLIGVNEEMEPGDYIEKGALLGGGVSWEIDPEPKVAYVLYIWYDNKQIQVSPCSVENTGSFCGVCYQYDGYCPETNLNFPEGGIHWWDESSPFWDTHDITIYDYAN